MDYVCYNLHKYKYKLEISVKILQVLIFVIYTDRSSENYISHSEILEATFFESFLIQYDY